MVCDLTMTGEVWVQLEFGVLVRLSIFSRVMDVYVLSWILTNMQLKLLSILNLENSSGMHMYLHNFCLISCVSSDKFTFQRFILFGTMDKVKVQGWLQLSITHSSYRIRSCHCKTYILWFFCIALMSLTNSINILDYMRKTNCLMHTTMVFSCTSMPGHLCKQIYHFHAVDHSCSLVIILFYLCRWPCADIWVGPVQLVGARGLDFRAVRCSIPFTPPANISRLCCRDCCIGAPYHILYLACSLAHI